MATLANKVVIVTGASSGIGEAAAIALGRRGACIVLAARRIEKLERVKRRIESEGGRAVAVSTDITKPSEREALAGETIKTFGRIDALVNNAGYGQRGPIEMVPAENIRGNFETNLFSLIALTQLVIPVMRKQGAGRIVNIGSVAGKIARPFSSIYDSTKHALEAISDGMRGELKPFGIEVVLIEPGFILTDFLEVAREVASPVVGQEDSPYFRFLAKHEQNYERMRKFAGKPEDIAAAIIRALASSRPKARYAAPRLASFLLAMKWLMPDRAFDYVIHRQMGLTRGKHADGAESSR